MTTAQVALLIVGAGLELLGIGLAVLESIDVRRAFLRRSAIARSGVARATVTAHGAVVNVTGHEPTVGERVARLEVLANRVQQDLNLQAVTLRDQFRDELQQEARAVREDMEFQVSDVRRLLGVSVQPKRRRAIGFALFALGLVLQTASQF